MSDAHPGPTADPGRAGPVSPNPTGGQAPAATPPATGRRGRAHVVRLLDTYRRSAPSPDLAEIRLALWGPGATTPPQPLTSDEQSALLEQYKVYVEMADRISARRGLANTFFLTINTAVFTAVGVFWEHRPAGPSALMILPWAMLVVQCLAWFWILRSYRQLNTAKYAVIGAMEERLPASPYWAAEWAALGRGEDPSRYWPLSHVEQWIPGLFAAGYTVGLLLALLA